MEIFEGQKPAGHVMTPGNSAACSYEAARSNAMHRQEAELRQANDIRTLLGDLKKAVERVEKLAKARPVPGEFDKIRDGLGKMVAALNSEQLAADWNPPDRTQYQVEIFDAVAKERICFNVGLLSGCERYEVGETYVAHYEFDLTRFTVRKVVINDEERARIILVEVLERSKSKFIRTNSVLIQRVG